MQVDTDPRAGWCSWSRSKWNDVLVDAVFRRRPAGTLVRRIDTTQSWMARVAGAREIEGDAVRAAFLGLFRDLGLPARALFSPARLTRGWAPSDPTLPFFAELYLSLIVASADERTADLGRYRERLTELTGVGAGALIGHELPNLWRNAAHWSTTTTAVDVARLVLPAPGNEAIIGIAKRLAFPGYLDQQRLAALLARTGLDDRAPVADLLAALRADLAGFSDHFQAEFREFRDRYQRDPFDAARTPFWQALQELSWAACGQTGRAHGTLDLELDPSDPYDARLTVIVSGVSLAFDDWTRVDDPVLPPGSSALVRADQRAGPTLEAIQYDAVRGVSTNAVQVRRIRLGLRTGVIAFTRQDLDRWMSAERLVLGDDVWLLARHDVARRLGDTLRTRAGHPVYDALLPGSHAWKLIGPTTITEATRILLASVSGGTRLFDDRMPSARIDLSGSVTLPGGIYLRRPLLPLVRADLANACSFHASNADGELLRSGTMEGRGENMFALPADLPTHGVAQLRFDAHGQEGLVASRTIEVVGRCTAERLVPLSRPDHWLVDDDSGGLVALADAAPPHSKATFPALPCLDRGHAETTTSQLQVPAAEAASDIVEMFAAILSRRQTLPARRALELIIDRHGGSAASGWAILATLTENGVVRLVAPRHWRGLAVTAAVPEAQLVMLPAGCRARVFGTFAELQRLRLADVAARAGIEVTVNLGNNHGAIGATEFLAPDIPTARAILSSVGIGVGLAGHQDPIAPLGYLPFVAAEVPTGVRSRWWDPTTSMFGDVRGDVATTLELRSFERRRDIFVLSMGERAFVTESRRWALLAWAIAQDRTVGSFTADGSITLSRPELALPPSAARTVLIHGGGVVSRDASGHLVYPSGGTRALIDQFDAWRTDSRSVDKPNAFIRALARHPGQSAVAIALNRQAASLTSAPRSAL